MISLPTILSSKQMTAKLHLGYPLLRWKILKAIFSHFAEIFDDLSPILVIISNGFSFILEAVFNEFSSISETVSHEFFHLSGSRQ